uniref:Uncharacterized protein n=1 Tax=Rhizophora mucronata TaxID=61149 RepID=A0A2P2QVJ7_RHIMU
MERFCPGTYALPRNGIYSVQLSVP